MAYRAKRGDLLAQLSPFVLCVDEKHLAKLCSHCLGDGKLLKCTSCKVMRYCNATCQRKDWKFHKVECKCFQKNAFTNPLLRMVKYRIFLRLIIRKNKGETELKCDELQIRCFDDLMSHSEEIKNNPGKMEDFERLCSGLEIITQGVLKLPAREVIFDIFGKTSINAFGISTQAGTQYEGSAVYLSSSVFNHSCDPDVFISYCNNIMQIRAVRDFTYDRFSDIKMSYTDIIAPSYERQEELSRYYFTCQCPSCEDPTYMDQLMTSSKCPTEGCSGPILENADGSFAPCSECGNREYPANYADSKNKAMNDCKEAFEQFKGERVGQLCAISYNTYDAHNLYARVLNTAMKVLHPSNVHLMRVLDKAFRVCGMFRTHEKMLEAVKYGRMRVEALKLLPPCVKSNSLYPKELGHFEFFVGHYREALDAYSLVSEIIPAMYGPNHRLTLDLEKSIYQVCLVLAQAAAT